MNLLISNKLMFILSLMYIVAYFFTVHLFNENTLGYTFFSLVLIFSNFIYSVTIQSKKIIELKWIILIIVNIAFFIKFYVIVYIMHISNNTVYELVLLGRRLPVYMELKSLYDVFGMSVGLYIILAISFLLADKVNLSNRLNNKRILFRSRALVVLITIVILMFFLSTLFRIIFKESLFESISIVLNSYFVPLLFIFLIIASIRSANSFLAKGLALLFVFAGIIQFSQFASKMFVVLPVLWVLVIQSVTKFKLINTKLFLLSPLAILIYPLFNIYREVLLSDSGGSIFEQVLQRLESNELNIVYLAFLSILHRFIGVDSFIVLKQARDTTYSVLDFFDVISMTQSVSNILTYDILGYEFTMGVATSLFGELYFLGGGFFVTALILACVVFFSSLFLRYLVERNSVFCNALGVYFVVFASLYFNEGVILLTLKYQLFTIVLFFILYKLFFVRRPIYYEK